jgi:hypothetical protein
MVPYRAWFAGLCASDLRAISRRVGSAYEISYISPAQDISLVKFRVRTVQLLIRSVPVLCGLMLEAGFIVVGAANVHPCLVTSDGTVFTLCVGGLMDSFCSSSEHRAPCSRLSPEFISLYLREGSTALCLYGGGG